MIVKYVRVSTNIQNTQRQVLTSGEYDLLIEDCCSGNIPLFKREGGKKLKHLIEKGKVDKIIVHQTDRLSRNLLDVLQTIEFCNTHKVCIHIQQQNLKTLDENGNEDTIAKLGISMLASIAHLETKLSRERIMEGIALAKAANKYKGRKSNTKETVLDFLSKPKTKMAVEMFKRGYKGKEIAKILNISVNTVTKIKKIAKI